MQQAGSIHNEHETWTTIEFDALNRISIFFFADTLNWMWRKAEMEIEESAKQKPDKIDWPFFFLLALYSYPGFLWFWREPWAVRIYFFVRQLRINIAFGGAESLLYSLLILCINFQWDNGIGWNYWWKVRNVGNLCSVASLYHFYKFIRNWKTRQAISNQIFIPLSWSERVNISLWNMKDIRYNIQIMHQIPSFN